MNNAGLSAFNGTTWTDFHVGNSGLTNDTVRSITVWAGWARLVRYEGRRKCLR